MITSALIGIGGLLLALLSFVAGWFLRGAIQVTTDVRAPRPDGWTPEASPESDARVQEELRRAITRQSHGRIRFS